LVYRWTSRRGSSAEQQHLRAEMVGDVVVHLAAEEHDALPQQAVGDGVVH
jgi:hypothetical protein